jgi:hypothetical protein
MLRCYLCSNAHFPGKFFSNTGTSGSVANRGISWKSHTKQIVTSMARSSYIMLHRLSDGPVPETAITVIDGKDHLQRLKDHLPSAEGAAVTRNRRGRTARMMRHGSVQG